MAFEEMPLADFLAGDQARALQGGKVGGHRRLRKPGPLIDLAGANAMLQRVFLPWKARVRVLEPDQDFTANRVGQGFHDFVEVDRHAVLNGWCSGISRYGELYIGVMRYTNTPKD